jgi:hypothetical protein
MTEKSPIDIEFDEEGAKHVPPEFYIAKALKSRLDQQDLLRKDDRQSMAFRIAEIMVETKRVYTATLPRLMGETVPDEGETLSLEQEMIGLRMTMLHLRDIIAEFDIFFMEAMVNDQDPSSKSDSAWLNPDEWEEDELEEETPRDPSMN